MIYCQNVRGAGNAKFHPSLQAGVDVLTDVCQMDDFVRTKIFLDAAITRFSYSWCSTACASCAQELRCEVSSQLTKFSGASKIVQNMQF